MRSFIWRLLSGFRRKYLYKNIKEVNSFFNSFSISMLSNTFSISAFQCCLQHHSGASSPSGFLCFLLVLLSVATNARISCGPKNLHPFCVWTRNSHRMGGTGAVWWRGCCRLSALHERPARWFRSAHIAPQSDHPKPTEQELQNPSGGPERTRGLPWFASLQRASDQHSHGWTSVPSLGICLGAVTIEGGGGTSDGH